MIQVKSTCKLSTLVAGELRRQYPLCLLSLVALLLALPGSFMYFLRWVQNDWVDDGMNSVYYAREQLTRSFYFNRATFVVLGVLAVLSAVVVLHYLHNHKQTEFYHALPVGRIPLLVSRIIVGVLAVLPAYVISFAALLATCTVFGKTGLLCAPLLLQKALLEISTFFIVYAISVLACVLTGSTVAALTVDAFLQCCCYLVWQSAMQLIRWFYPSCLLISSDWNMTFLSPLYFFWRRTEVGGDIYIQNLMNKDGFLDTAKAIGQHRLYAETGMLPAMIGYIVAAAILLAAAVWIYRLRRSERTGTAIAFRGIRLPLKYLAMTMAAIGLGELLLTFTNFLPLLFLGLAAGAVLAAVAVEMLFQLDFRGAVSKPGSLLGYLVVAAIVVAVMQLDVTGYNTKLPERSQIVSANVFSDDAALSVSGGDTEELESDIEYNKWMRDALQDSQLASKENLDAIYSMAQRGVQSMRGKRQLITNNARYNIAFTLADGSTFVRSYYLSGDEQSAEYRVLVQRAAAVRFSKEYLSSRTPAVLADPKKTQAIIVQNSSQADFDGELITDSNVIDALLTTIQKESQQLTKEYVLKHPAIMVLQTKPTGDTNFAKQLENGTVPSEEYRLTFGQKNAYGIPVYACEKETIRLLQEQGIRVRRFDKADISMLELHYYQSMDTKSMQQSLDSNADYLDDKSGKIREPQLFDDLLTGAVATSIVQCCDPIVVAEGISKRYEGFLYTAATDREQSSIYYYYMKNMVQDDWKDYLED